MSLKFKKVYTPYVFCDRHQTYIGIGALEKGSVRFANHPDPYFETAEKAFSEIASIIDYYNIEFKGTNLKISKKDIKIDPSYILDEKVTLEEPQDSEDVIGLKRKVEYAADLLKSIYHSDAFSKLPQDCKDRVYSIVLRNDYEH